MNPPLMAIFPLGQSTSIVVSVGRPFAFRPGTAVACTTSVGVVVGVGLAWALVLTASSTAAAKAVRMASKIFDRSGDSPLAD